MTTTRMIARMLSFQRRWRLAACSIPASTWDEFLCFRLQDSQYHRKQQLHNYHNMRPSSTTKTTTTTTKTTTRTTTIIQNYNQLRQDHALQIQSLPEWQASVSLLQFLRDHQATDHHRDKDGPQVGLPIHALHEQRALLDAILSTFCLHVESRIAALMGLGFYTIGPCGEETLAAAALAFQPRDTMALHYRHSAILMARQLLKQNSSDHYDDALKSLLLDRARGYTVSQYDPVTGGVHCSIGGGDGSESSDCFVVTSTLASQCSPAVGRALATGLMSKNSPNDCTKKQRPVSFVTIGDGSAHHGHFWSAFHLARHARHLRIKCPVVFGISDNGLSISYSTRGYVDTLFGHDPLIPLFRADGNRLQDVLETTLQAITYARKHSAPAVILYQKLSRRFGHAATDRQAAYLTPQDIQARAESNVLQQALIELVQHSSSATTISFSDVHRRMLEIQVWVQAAFAQAVTEPKVNRQDMLQRMQIPKDESDNDITSKSNYILETTAGKRNSRMAGNNDNNNEVEEDLSKRSVMRKHMTRAYAELLAEDDTIVYLGEDVRHGGYYLVTEDLVKQFPKRVIDFPPDETSLLGAALGMSQSGLRPIVEIPYAKYLDCAADIMAEIAILPWLVNSSKNHSSSTGGGMVIRLQGFDRGLFGGNFHTHNSLSNVLLPGIDVLCYSNGFDYVRGLRYAMSQVRRHGRVVVLVDCTYLLNLRHLYSPGDRQWETPYPQDDGSSWNFDTIQIYRDESKNNHDIENMGVAKRLAIVSYGNGVVTCLQARSHIVSSSTAMTVVDVLDCPCLNRVPRGLLEALPQYDYVLFADICKEGPGSVFGSMVVDHNVQKLLGRHRPWKVVAAPRTYNPLGSLETFLNVEDVVEAAMQLLQEESSLKHAGVR